MNSATLNWKKAQETIRTYEKRKKRQNEWKDSEIWILCKLHFFYADELTYRQIATEAAKVIDRSPNAIRTKLDRLVKTESSTCDRLSH